MGEARPRSILITGSGSGIGAAIARKLAAPGHAIVLHALTNRSGCERVAADLREAGAETNIVLGDLSDPPTGRRLVETTVEVFGGLDVLVANAGFPERRPFGEIDRAGFDHTHAVIAGGFFEMATAALPHLAAAGRSGRVVTVSTHNAHVFRTEYPFYPASSSAKAGLEALTRALAMQLAPHGVTVNCVVPGLVKKDPDTPQFLSEEEWRDFIRVVPLGRIGEPEEVADVVAYLCSAGAGYVTGQRIHVNGGMI